MYQWGVKDLSFLSGMTKNVVHTTLMLSPFKSEWGTCMLQAWVRGFNLDNPSNLLAFFKIWVALRNLHFKHHDQALAIAETI